MRLNIDYENLKTTINSYNNNLIEASNKLQTSNEYTKSRNLLLNYFDKNIYALNNSSNEFDESYMINSLNIFTDCINSISIISKECEEYINREINDCKEYLNYFKNIYETVKEYDTGIDSESNIVNLPNEEKKLLNPTTNKKKSKKNIVSIAKKKKKSKSTKAKKVKKKNIQPKKSSTGKKAKKIKSIVKKKNNKKTSAKKVSKVTAVLGLSTKVIQYAKQFLGHPYVYGGNSLTSGIDCSAFVQQIYGKFGYTLQRTTQTQVADSKYKTISLNDIQPGDLLYYKHGNTIGHVTMYIGNGQVIHASNPKDGIKISPITYRTPVTAKRIIS